MITGLGRNGTQPKSKPKFKRGDIVKCWVSNLSLGKVIGRYYMDWTCSNPSGGWYYDTTVLSGMSENILAKEKK